MMDYAGRFAQFQESRQPPVCLRIAMEDFFQDDLPEEYRTAYGAYLQKRVRALAEKLIDLEDVDKLETLDRLGWLTPALVETFCKTAMQHRKSAALVWLLGKKQETYGFAKQDFSL